MTKKLLVAFASLLLLIGAGCGATVPPNSPVTLPDTQPVNEQPVPTPAPTPAPEPAPVANPSAQPSAGAKVYTMTEIAAHKDASSCWTAVNGNVYDITAWVGQHPGGPNAILSLCGNDGSAAFNAQHGGSTPQENKLASFKIGTLKK